MSIDQSLLERSGALCELCGGYDGLEAYKVAPKDEEILICEVCSKSINEPQLDEKHWNCLTQSMWSIVPAVQVVTFRLLTKLGQQDQLDMMLIEDDVREWAEAGISEDSNTPTEPTRDSNGTILEEGDSITIIKDLVVKGAGFTAKQGTTVKNIHIVPNDNTMIEGRVNGTKIFLLSKFLKKV